MTGAPTTGAPDTGTPEVAARGRGTPAAVDAPAGVRRRRLVALLTAESISMLGTRTSFFAIPWLVLVTTGSPERMGLVAAAELLPYVVAGVIGAPLIDRIGPRRASVAADVLSALAMAGVALFSRQGLLALAVLVAVVGAGRGVADRARSVLLRPTVEAAGMDLTRATSIYDGIGRLTLVLGAPLGGLVIGWLGPAGAIWADAVSFALCALIVATLVVDATLPDAMPSGKEPEPAAESYGTALVNGARFVVRDGLLLGLTAMFLVANLATQATTTVFIPLWVRDALGSPSALGLVSGAFALGALAGNVAFTVLATRLPRYATLAVGSLIGGAPRLLVLAASQSLTVVLPVSFLCGVALASVNPIIGAVLYERVPSRLQARVFGITAAVAYAGLPLGGLAGGWTAQHWGLTTALVVGAAVSLAADAVPLLMYGRWRPLVDRPD